MRHRTGLFCFALALTITAARADILPAPDRGPPMASAGGLDFAVQSVRQAMGPVDGPHYYKTVQVVVLTGCDEGRPNCKLAHERKLIGMEVESVDGEYLRPENGMVQQIVDAFARKNAGRTLVLELYARAANSEAVKISFARD